MSRYRVTTSVEIVFDVRNTDATERVTGPGGDEWRSQFYRLHTLDDVLEHWAYNVICNGVFDISLLEGWADLQDADVGIDIEHSDLDLLELLS
jgi:hypothetical protein